MNTIYLPVLTALLLAVQVQAQTSALQYSRTLGGSGLTQGLALAYDTNDNVFITGNTTATNLATAGAYQTNFPGYQAAFVAEFDTNGTLQFFTYLGGAGYQSGQGITVDLAGDIFVTGCTSSTNFPIKGALQATNGGNYDAFVTELSPGGSNLVFSTYLGGHDIDSGNSIVLDTNGSPIITGYTQSTNFPTANAFQPAYGGNGDAFVTKLDPSGSSLVYSTFLGGTNGENDPGFVITSQTSLIPGTGGAIASDDYGCAYVTGWTASTNFPILNGLQPTNMFLSSGAVAAFVAKLDPVGNLLYSTYFGGQIRDYGYAIGVDGSNNIYFAGSCVTPDLPITNAYQSAFPGGGRVGYLAALDSTGTNVLYCTYLGGTGAQQVNAIAVRFDGAVAVSGTTSAPNFPLVNAFQSNGPAAFPISTNNGGTWNTTSAGLSQSGATVIATDPFNPATLYAVSQSVLFKSVNRGVQWNLINNAICGGYFNSRQSLITFDPVHPGTIYYGGFYGAYKTVDGGNTWAELTNNAPFPSDIVCLAVDPRTPTTLYAGTDAKGLFKSVNGGTNWAAINTGLNNNTVTAVLVDPLNSSNVFVGLNNDFSGALFNSTNGGANWSVIPGLPSYAEPAITLAASPSAPSNIYAIIGDFLENATLLETTNSGASWTTPLQLLGGMMPALAVLPPQRPNLDIASDGNSNRLFWPASFTNYVLQSSTTLNATQWQTVASPAALVGGYNSLLLPTAYASGFYRLASTNGWPQQPSVYVGCDQASLEGLLESSDGGNTWQSVGLMGDTVNAIAVDPTNPNNIYAGTSSSDEFIATFAPGGQLYFSSYLGGSGLNIGGGIALDGANVFATGFTASPDFPTTPSQPRAHPRTEEGPPAVTSPATGGTGTAGKASVVSKPAASGCPDPQTINLTVHRNKFLAQGLLRAKEKLSSAGDPLPSGLSISETVYGDWILEGYPAALGTTTTVARFEAGGCIVEITLVITVVP